ncbi:unnamed protein product [Aphanomyces euteiches]
MDWPSITMPDAVLKEVAIDYSTQLKLTNYVVYPVTPLQAGMLHSTFTSRSAYVMQHVIELEDALTDVIVSEGFLRLAKQHEILRTTFGSLQSGLVQIIRQDSVDHVIQHVTVSRLEEFLQADHTRGFELGDSFFVRLATVVDDVGRYAVLTIHHSLYDGWSLPLLVSDLLDAFHGKSVTARPNFRAFVDYIQAQDEESTRLYWQSALTDVTPSIMALTNSPTKIEDNGISSLHFEVAGNELAQAAKRAGVSLATLTKFAWAATMRKFLRQDDVVMGQVLSNRNAPVKDIESPHQGSMLTHSHASLVDIKKWSDLGQDLFDTLFVFQQVNESEGERLAQSTVGAVAEARASTHYALELVLFVEDGVLHVQAMVDFGLLSRVQARMVLEEYKCTLDQVVLAIASKMVPLPYELLHHAFEERAAAKPDLLAVEFEGARITYGELNDQAATLAHELVSLGVGVGSRVAVVMERCLEFPIGLLAVLKAGGSMMPLDATFPANRLTFMLTDANASVVVTTELVWFGSIPEDNGIEIAGHSK